MTLELDSFMKQYEIAMNSHIFSNVQPLLCNDCVFYFSDGTFTGIHEAQNAFEKTRNTIQEELYSIHNVQWITVNDNACVCIYQFERK